jgi:hypothetical protein
MEGNETFGNNLKAAQDTTEMAKIKVNVKERILKNSF